VAGERDDFEILKIKNATGLTDGFFITASFRISAIWQSSAP